MGELKSVLNIDAETGANIIGAEATPVLSISNASTGPAIKVDNLVATSSATIASLSAAAGTVIFTKVTSTPAIPTANATIAGVVFTGASAASAPLISFSGLKTLASCTTIAFTTGGVDGTYAVRVALPSGLFGWIPILPDGAITSVVV